MRVVPKDGMDDDDRFYEDIKHRRGKAVALAVGAIADTAHPKFHGHTDKLWQWAEEKYDERDTAAEADTGYDPDEEYRRI